MSTQQQTSATFAVEVGGRPLAEEVAVHMVSAVVEDHLTLPDMFALRFRDTERTVLEDAGLRIGSEVTISVISDATPGPQKLIVGEVTALDAEFGTDGSFKVVRGLDHSHRLYRGRISETYRNVTYADVATRIAERNGIPIGTIDATTVVHDQVSQANLRDWDLLRSMATEIGYECVVCEGKLHFRKPGSSSDAPESGNIQSEHPQQLTLGTNLLRFHSTLTSAQQVTQVQVRGWDVEQKTALAANVASETTSATLDLQPAAVAGTFGTPTFVAVDTPFAKQADVEASAKAISSHIAGGFADFEGTARGNPKLRAGTPVSLGLAGKPFDGRYTLTSTRHEQHPDEGYTTWFSAAGSSDRSLRALVGVGEDHRPNHIHGVTIAIVTDARDPKRMGRVKVKFPWMSDSYESDWARVVHAGAGNNRGAFFVPEVNDEVLVAFEQGDMEFPVVLGGLFNGVDRNPLADGLVDGATGAINHRGLVSRKGHRLVFVDQSGKEAVRLHTGDKNVRIELEQSGSVLKISAKGDVTIEGSRSVNVRAGGALKLSGSNVEIASSGQLSLKSAGIMTISGSVVNIN